MDDDEREEQGENTSPFSSSGPRFDLHRSAVAKDTSKRHRQAHDEGHSSLRRLFEAEHYHRLTVENLNVVDKIKIYLRSDL